MFSDAVRAPLGLEHYAADLRRMACARLKPPLLGRIRPSDLVQQTLLIAHEKRDQFRGATRARMRHWLRTILRRQLALARRRCSERSPEQARSLGRPDEFSALLEGPGLASEDSSLTRVMVREEEWVALAAAVAALARDQRTALELHYFQGRSIQEVADAMGRSAPSVAGLLHRALQSLRETLT